jgi:5-methylcytosine-specific restriction endonuclease McrA
MSIRTLVLNADGLPLTIIGPQRAVLLAMSNAVTVLESHDTEWHSPSTTIKVPSVIALKKYVKVRHRDTPILTRRAVFARDNSECQYCGGKAENLDHIVPTSRGGKHQWLNVVAACIRCNSKKSDKLLKECGMQLRRQPYVPSNDLRFAGNAQWEQYLGG